MGNCIAKCNSYENIDDLEKKGVLTAKDLIKESFKKWQEKEIKIGVTGTSGVGKSSLINALRGIDVNDEQAAKTDVVTTTTKPSSYPYPDNLKIQLVDLPENITSCRDIFESCDTFLILTTERFKDQERKIAERIKSMKKSFLLVRTKIDLDETNESRKETPNMDKVIRNIRQDCLENVNDLGIGEDEIFVVNNYDKHKWDFNRLVEAIQNKLPTHQKEASIRSVKEGKRGKVEELKGQLCWVKFLLILVFFPLDIITLGLLSHLISRCQIKKKTKFYRSQLGLPEENSEGFMEMQQELKERMRKFYPKEENDFWEKYCYRILHPLEIILASKYTSNSLANVLTEMENLSMDLLDEAAAKAEQNFEEECEVE